MRNEAAMLEQGDIRVLYGKADRLKNFKITVESSRDQPVTARSLEENRGRDLGRGRRRYGDERDWDTETDAASTCIAFNGRYSSRPKTGPEWIDLGSSRSISSSRSRSRSRHYDYYSGKSSGRNNSSRR